MEKKISVIITMAGLGSRFKKAGYQCPKYMIEVRGKSLFEWSMESLADFRPHVMQTIFIVREDDHARDFIHARCQELNIAPIHIIELDHVTDGQASTAMQAIPVCDMSLPILIYNIDTYIEPFAMKFSDIIGDGHIPCFRAEGEHWSFVRLDRLGRAIEVREKKRISDNCSLGAYYFSSAQLFESLYNEYYSEHGLENNGERYIAPIYNLMIKKGMEVSISLIDESKVHVLGTPEELMAFANEYQSPRKESVR